MTSDLAIFVVVVEGPKPKMFRLAAPNMVTAALLVNGYKAFLEAVQIAREMQNKAPKED